MGNKTKKLKSYKCLRCQFEYDLPKDSYEKFIVKVKCPYCQGEMEMVENE